MQHYSAKDRGLILSRYRLLLRSAGDTVSPENRALIRSAFALSASLNIGVRGNSGLPYILHLADVARICVDEIGLGTSSVIAALLHEAIERNQLTRIEIEQRFGAKVAALVVGFTRISGLDVKNPKAQSENFRQLIISLSGDARVILIKLADRLETMRSLEHSGRDAQVKRSWETFHLYAPLAHRLGLYRVKSEMEDLAMRFIHPKEYRHIVRKLKETTTARERFIKDFVAPIDKELTRRGYNFEIKGRTKSIYSIFRKMQNQQVDFEDVHDIFAIRVILRSRPRDEKSDCWQVYSIVTDRYTPDTGRLRDWISVPKSSGYESLHTTVLGPESRWVEVQIRTARMDEIAERGLAAHWKYKGFKQEQGVDEWTLRVREVLESAGNPPEEQASRFDVPPQTSAIYVFTPKGDIRRLPANSTVLDFAFDIHSTIGAQCAAAIVNGKSSTIKQVLQNGDTVEIVTSKRQRPKKEWLSIVVTSKAKSKIKQELRDAENREIAEGKELLFRRFKNWKIDDADEALLKIKRHFKLKKFTDIFIQIAGGKIDPSSLKGIIAAEPAETPPQRDNTPMPDAPKTEGDKGQADSDFLIIDERLVNIDYKLAKCCNPIFGDDVFGFVTVSEGIKIHRASCPNANQLHNRWGYRIVGARWKASSKAGSFQSTIRITGTDELGILNRISEIISKDLKVNMRNLAVNSKNGLFEGTIQLYVEDTKHLEMLLYRLGRVQGVHRAVRIK